MLLKNLIYKKNIIKKQINIASKIYFTYNTYSYKHSTYIYL